MNGFLVLARCQIDDAPLYFTDDKADALKWAKAMTPEKAASIGARVLGVDAISYVHTIDIIDFHNGMPAKAYKAVDFDDKPKLMHLQEYMQAKYGKDDHFEVSEDEFIALWRRQGKTDEEAQQQIRLSRTLGSEVLVGGKFIRVREKKKASKQGGNKP